jgi:O-methyltransferase
MSVKISLIRKTKALFIRWRMHRFFGLFSGFFLNLAYLTRVSAWVSKNRDLTYNDFYSPVFDYAKRYLLYEFVNGEKVKGESVLYLEFGVFGGYSFKWWVEHNTHPDSRFFGFDTFEGLPEDWGGFKKGEMTTDSKIPEIKDPRADFRKGLFQETLPAFLKELDKEKKKVILMDADLYSSTLYVLTSLAPYLKKGDIVLFDEFNVPRHEFLAFLNFTESYYVKLKLFAAANNYYFCAFEVQSHPSQELT